MSATPKEKLQKATRRSRPPIKVYCLDEERAAIEANAMAAGLSTSALLRRVGAGHVVQNRIDTRQVRELAKLGADMGRVGGLLKAMLTNEERFVGVSGQQLQQFTTTAINELLETQTKIREGITGMFDRGEA